MKLKNPLIYIAELRCLAACSVMSTGLKHVATEPTPLEKKRERRRTGGAATRAATLRRAPSDSDCSGETASLSADSGDRARQPPPPPPRANARGRRRGSEWEVLEGLKDGQRFERRPEVFNGYLHKKRKWPLKGWHKRFFVVDGGILVYARSPTDVARGRLHGSLDVGLSVISAKPRRRRIDIDADEFIYHLRAKTPDVFRTWLNVLKAHRLYRQHLLTFGARESVPKIHAPLEELPPNDNSSRTSDSSYESFSTLTSLDTVNGSFIKYKGPNFSMRHRYTIPTVEGQTNKTSNVKPQSSNDIEKVNETSSELVPFNFEIDRQVIDVRFVNQTKKHGSLCSMNCVNNRINNESKDNANKCNAPAELTENETQMHCTDLDINSLKSVEPKIMSTFLGNVLLNSLIKKPEEKNSPKDIQNCRNALLPINSFRKEKSSTNQQITATLFFNSKRKCSLDYESQFKMKRSKKSTNLHKYRNAFDEPPLKKPLKNCMLLGKYKLDANQKDSRGISCDLVAENICKKENKSVQNLTTVSEYDRITEKLMGNLINNHENKILSSSNELKCDELRYCVKKFVKELYDNKTAAKTHPVQFLFKCLLEFWLKNTTGERLKDITKEVKNLNKPSNEYFTKDANLSGALVNTECKGTQVFDRNTNRENITRIPGKPCKSEKKKSSVTQSPKQDSFEKERRIQQLERLLRSTVYICETVRSRKSRDKDIKITKTLINNLEKISNDTDLNNSNETSIDVSDSSMELPQIQETINKLISETDIPAGVAKDFLHAYLDVLMHDGSKSITSDTSRESSCSFKTHQDNGNIPTCEVQTEAVKTKISKSVSTSNEKVDMKNCVKDPGQLFLKELLDKITTVFSKSNKNDTEVVQNKEPAKDETSKQVQVAKERNEQTVSDKEISTKELVYENLNDNCIVIDLTKHNLEHISMVKDGATKGIMSIVIKLKEKSVNSCNKQFSFKLIEETLNPNILCPTNLAILKPDLNTTANCFKKSYINSKIFFSNDGIELKPYTSNSNSSSLIPCRIHPHQNSYTVNIIKSKTKIVSKNEDPQCYVLSSLKNGDVSTSQTKKKDWLKYENGVLNPNRQDTKEMSFDKDPARVIDEKFILMLLENLALLAKNFPGLHKDINDLYLKLRKRYDRNIGENNVVSGLDLLGKIYNKESYVKKSDGNKQFDGTDGPDFVNDEKSNYENDNISHMVLKKTISAPILSKIQFNCPVQTGADIRKSFYDDASNRSQNKGLKTQSSSNWLIKKDCTMSMITKCMLQKGSSQNFVFNSAKPIKLCETIQNKQHEKQFHPIKQMSPLSSSYKVSTQSQTERKCYKLEEFKVYQLFLSRRYNSSLSESMVGSCIDGSERSEDLRTIYRCSSDPSYCSGLISPIAPLKGPQAGFVSGTPGGRLASWIIESGGPLESASRELGQAQLSVQQLQRLLDALELQHVHHDTDVSKNNVEVDVLYTMSDKNISL